MTMDDCRRGYERLKAMSRWESYAENDPVLRGPGNSLADSFEAAEALL
jgi:hypothetical protein